ncbi:MAG: hypothetical protein H6Q52_1644 [Deltaproteobacteria bacterium]|nr:hypothetical protein [Deltaproteobacteria bacterium]
MMRKAAIILFALPLFFLSCAHVGKRPASITWPGSFDYMEALCEIDVMLKNSQYTGDMSLKVAYPHMLFLEVYSPFGTTMLSVDRSEDHFIMRTDNELLTDENEFYRLFNIQINDIIEDITLKGPIRTDSAIPYKQRPGYTVYYYLNDAGNRICWKVEQGDFCIRFVDVSFSREKPDGKSNSGTN